MDYLKDFVGKQRSTHTTSVPPIVLPSRLVQSSSEKLNAFHPPRVLKSVIILITLKRNESTYLRPFMFVTCHTLFIIC